jgi:lantibiotic biosynthesis protein
MGYFFLDKLALRTPCNPYQHKNVIDLNAIREALYLASPALTQELDKYDKGQTRDERDKRKLCESLYKYHSRSCTRCTPFGLFAGVGICEWGDKTDVRLADTRRRETRLDMNYVCALGQFIASITAIRDCLLFYPNNSIYRIADKVRYVEYKYIRTRRSHSITEVDGSEYLHRVLDLAAKGALLKDLAMSITGDDIDIDEAMEFVLSMLDSQLLKSEIDPNVTGDFYFDVLLRKLQELKENQLQESKELEHIINILSLIDVKVKKLDEKFSNEVTAYKEIIELVKQLPVKFEENTLFQTDLYLKPESGIINKGIKDELIKVISLLNKLNTMPRETSLSKFAEEYFKRYEDAELPLLYVLDTESGIGYSNNKGADNNPLVDGLAFPMMPQHTNSIHYNHIGLALHKKLKEAYRNGAYSVLFTDDDFKHIPDPGDKNIPATFMASFSLCGEDDKVIFNFAGGSCGAAVLGRFAGADQQILDISRKIIEHENKFFADKIIAEIVHLPESRTGNVLMRPAFREYEIPYLANSFTTASKTIPLSDLFVSIRARSQVVLKSKKLNKEIMPRLTNAHNFSLNALPVYQFLCDLQLQGTKPVFSFSWGAFAQEYQFKPRAVYGNIILKEATWDLRTEDIKDLADKGFDKERIRLFLEKWQMPSIVLLAEADNTLLVEWYNKLSFSTFINTIKKRPGFTLKEHVFDGAAVKDRRGNAYENEFHAFVINDLINKETASEKFPAAQTSVQRTFPIGSEWLYYKIYAGIKTADRLLSNHIKPLTEDMLAKGLVDKWFFIRYTDPDKHLRVRFHIPEMSNYGKVIARISGSINTLMDERTVWKIQTDTYDREIERYGAFTIEDCENYFWHDSVFVATLISFITDQDAERIRWIAGFRAVDELLDSFGFNMETKKEFVDKLGRNFKKQYGNDKYIRVILDKKFRTLRKDIELNLDRKKDAENGLQEIWDLLNEKTRQTSPITKKINESKQYGLINGDEYEQLLTSLLHMMLNRLFKSQQQMHELVIYDLLFLYYRSMIARKKSQAGSARDFSLPQGQVLKAAESLRLDI